MIVQASLYLDGSNIPMESGSVINPYLARLLLCLTLVNLGACGQLVSNAKQEFAQDLSATIVEFDDPETIRRGVPAYLILVSSMIRGEPDNPELLESGAQLYSAYASGFVEDPRSRLALANRAFDYGGRAICIRVQPLCDHKSSTYFDYEMRLQSVQKEQARSLLIFAASWAGQIEANSSDWNAVAELPKVKATISRVLELDENVDDGNAHLYMAVMESLLPPTLGGKPDLAKEHFERAIEISGGSNLMAKVLYAEKYARLLFDRELHDELLKQVIAADIGDEGQRLINTLAKRRAEELLSRADDYF